MEVKDIASKQKKSELNMENKLSTIDGLFGNRSLKYNSYWNDKDSFALDIGDGELVNKDGEPYFIHCEYNRQNGIWHYVFEIWFDDDFININDFYNDIRDEYLTETQMEELRAIIYNLVSKNINL